MNKIKKLVEDTMKEYIRKAGGCRSYKEANLNWSKEKITKDIKETTQTFHAR